MDIICEYKIYMHIHTYMEKGYIQYIWLIYLKLYTYVHIYIHVELYLNVKDTGE